MKVNIDRDKCVGGGRCVAVAPDVFDQGEADGLVVLMQEQPAAELHAAVREAVQACPSGAIELAGE